MTTIAPERWLPVVRWEGRYEVSDQGNVRSLWAPNGPRRLPRALKQRVHAPAPDGRMVVQLHDGRHRRPETRLVHHLVLEAFVGPRPDGQETRHGPGWALDNRLVNLCWGTHVDNVGVDKVRDGTNLFGERHPGEKLTEADVHEIRRRRKGGEMMKVLAREFGVDAANISAIVNGKSWKWLSTPE